MRLNPECVRDYFYILKTSFHSHLICAPIILKLLLMKPQISYTQLQNSQKQTISKHPKFPIQLKQYQHFTFNH